MRKKLLFSLITGAFYSISSVALADSLSDLGKIYDKLLADFIPLKDIPGIASDIEKFYEANQIGQNSDFARPHFDGENTMKLQHSLLVVNLLSDSRVVKDFASRHGNEEDSDDEDSSPVLENPQAFLTSFSMGGVSILEKKKGLFRTKTPKYGSVTNAQLGEYVRVGAADKMAPVSVKVSGSDGYRNDRKFYLEKDGENVFLRIKGTENVRVEGKEVASVSQDLKLPVDFAKGSFASYASGEETHVTVTKNGQAIYGEEVGKNLRYVMGKTSKALGKGKCTTDFTWRSKSDASNMSLTFEGDKAKLDIGSYVLHLICDRF